MGIMLVYDITNEKSFDNIKNWIRNIEEHASSDVERMILGNKCDMNDKRQVSKERGEKLAIDYGIKFLETSAKSSTNVEEAFFTLARDIMTKLNRKMNDSNSSGAGGPVKITESRSKKTSFFRCSLLWWTPHFWETAEYLEGPSPPLWKHRLPSLRVTSPGCCGEYPGTLTSQHRPPSGSQPCGLAKERAPFFKHGSNDVETHVGPNWFFLVLLPVLEAAVFLCTWVSAFPWYSIISDS